MNVIKKSFLVLSLTLAMVSTSAQTSKEFSPTQKGVPAFWNKIILELNVGVGTKHDGMSPLELGANMGYRFIPRMYAFVHGGNTFGLYDDENGRRYSKSQTLGGGIGYTLCKVDNAGVDLRLSVGSSVGNADWKYTVYDASLVFRVGDTGKVKINIGLGYRHVNSRTAGIDTYNGLFGTVGFGF